MAERDLLDALSHGDSFEKFRLEYDTAHRAMRRSLATERLLMDKVIDVLPRIVDPEFTRFPRPSNRPTRHQCRELSEQVINYAIKLQKAVRLKHEDDVTITELRRDTAKAWKIADTSTQREQAALELVQKLKTEIDELRERVRELGGAVLVIRGKYREALIQSHQPGPLRDALLSEVGLTLEGVLEEIRLGTLPQPIAQASTTQLAVYAAEGMQEGGFGLMGAGQSSSTNTGLGRGGAGGASPSMVPPAADRMSTPFRKPGARGLRWVPEGDSTTQLEGIGVVNPADRFVGTVSFEDWQAQRQLLAAGPALAEAHTPSRQRSVRGGGARPVERGEFSEAGVSIGHSASGPALPAVGLPSPLTRGSRGPATPMERATSTGVPRTASNARIAR